MTIRINQTYQPLHIQPNNETEYLPQTLGEHMIKTLLRQDLASPFQNCFPNEQLIRCYYFSDGMTLLHKAAEYDAVQCLRYLVEMTNDPDILSKTGITPLAQALSCQSDAAIAYLRSIGAGQQFKMLSQLIGESGTIAKADRDQLLQFAVLIETYTGIVTNLRDYFNQLCLRFIRDDDNDLLFMESLRLISRDHLQQLSGLVQTAANWDLSSALALIDRYLLTKQLHEHFDVIYRHLTADSELIRFGEMMGSVTDLGTLTWDQLNTMQELIDPYRQ